MRAGVRWMGSREVEVVKRRLFVRAAAPLVYHPSCRVASLHSIYIYIIYL